MLSFWSSDYHINYHVCKADKERTADSSLTAISSLCSIHRDRGRRGGRRGHFRWRWRFLTRIRCRIVTKCTPNAASQGLCIVWECSNMLWIIWNERHCLTLWGLGLRIVRCLMWLCNNSEKSTQKIKRFLIQYKKKSEERLQLMILLYKKFSQLDWTLNGKIE